MESLIHCHKCKHKTKTIELQTVQMKNGLYWIVSRCSKSKTDKSKIIKNPNEDPKPNNKNYIII